MQSVQEVNWFRMESFGIWPLKSNEFLEKLAPKNVTFKLGFLEF